MTDFISVYSQCIDVLEEIEEILLWEQLWIDLETSNLHFQGDHLHR